MDATVTFKTFFTETVLPNPQLLTQKQDQWTREAGSCLKIQMRAIKVADVCRKLGAALILGLIGMAVYARLKGPISFPWKTAALVPLVFFGTSSLFHSFANQQRRKFWGFHRPEAEIKKIQQNKDNYEIIDADFLPVPKGLTLDAFLLAHAFVQADKEEDGKDTDQIQAIARTKNLENFLTLLKIQLFVKNNNHRKT